MNQIQKHKIKKLLSGYQFLNPNIGYLYISDFGCSVKIGMSKAPEERIKTFERAFRQHGAGNRCLKKKFFKTVDMENAERILLTLFKNKRTSGEFHEAGTFDMIVRTAQYLISQMALIQPSEEEARHQEKERADKFLESITKGLGLVPIEDISDRILEDFSQPLERGIEKVVSSLTIYTQQQMAAHLIDLIDDPNYDDQEKVLIIRDKLFSLLE